MARPPFIRGGQGRTERRGEQPRRLRAARLRRAHRGGDLGAAMRVAPEIRRAFLVGLIAGLTMLAAAMLAVWWLEGQ